MSFQGNGGIDDFRQYATYKFVDGLDDLWDALMRDGGTQAGVASQIENAVRFYLAEKTKGIRQEFA